MIFIKKHLKKFLVAIGLLGVAYASTLIPISQPHPVGAIPCIENTAKSVKERVLNCRLSSKEKSDIVSNEVMKHNFVGTYLEDGTTIEITELKKGEIGIEIYARAWRNGKQLGFGKDGTVDIERFRFPQPRLSVPDGTTRIVKDDRGRDVELKNTKEDVVAATRTMLVQTINTKGVAKTGTKIISGSVGNTTDTYYPDTGSGGTTADGYVRRQVADESWATIRAGAGTNFGTADTTQRTGFTGAYTFLSRLIFTFDTSGITDTDTIDSATLSLYGSAKNDQFSMATPPNIDVYASTPAANNDLQASDYGQIGSTSLSGAPISYANWSIIAYNDFALNATGLANITKTGVSKFGTRNANYDVSGTDPAVTNASDEDLRNYMADQALTTLDPKLVVVHTAAAGAASPTFNPHRKSFIID